MNHSGMVNNPNVLPHWCSHTQTTFSSHRNITCRTLYGWGNRKTKTENSHQTPHSFRYAPIFALLKSSFWLVHFFATWNFTSQQLKYTHWSDFLIQHSKGILVEGKCHIDTFSLGERKNANLIFVHVV